MKHFYSKDCPDCQEVKKGLKQLGKDFAKFVVYVNLFAVGAALMYTIIVSPLICLGFLFDFIIRLF